MKKETKMVYETPWMECMQIEAEGDFMAGSIVKEPIGDGTTISADSQDYVSIDASSKFDETTEKYVGTNITWE